MIRVVVVDDHTLMRSGIRGLLALTEDICVVAEAGDGEEAIRIIRESKPDLVLLDVRLPKISGLKVLETLGNQGNLPFTILLTTFDDDEVLLQGMRAGAKGFLLKDVSLERLVSAIRRVMAGESCFRPALTERTLDGIKNIDHDFDSLGFPFPLTPREIEVLALIAGGYNNMEIANALGTMEGTVKNHVSSILSKLGVRDRVQAVFKGIDRGVL
ncbi:MAG: response regulator transcription factor [Methyloglobulus sp.]|nr:response regulator transcription factor [Methyloglobulus sp.]